MELNEKVKKRSFCRSTLRILTCPRWKGSFNVDFLHETSHGALRAFWKRTGQGDAVPLAEARLWAQGGRWHGSRQGTRDKAQSFPSAAPHLWSRGDLLYFPHDRPEPWV